MRRCGVGSCWMCEIYRKTKHRCGSIDICGKLFEIFQTFLNMLVEFYYIIFIFYRERKTFSHVLVAIYRCRTRTRESRFVINVKRCLLNKLKLTVCCAPNRLIFLFFFFRIHFLGMKEKLVRQTDHVYDWNTAGFSSIDSV